jgi:ABC-type branched-subunit amino acid transport system substrate-binding protein
LGLHTIFVVDDTEIYGQELADIFTGNLKDGGTVLGHGQISKDETPAQVAQLVQKIVSGKPDAVFYGGVTSNGAGYLKEQLVQAGFSGPLIGGVGIADDQQFLDDAGPVANNTYAIASGPDPSTLPQSFIQNYQRYYGPTKPSQIVAQSYDATMILITAIKSVIRANLQIMHSDVGTIRRAVRDAVQHPEQPYTGLTGPITFDSNGDNAVAKTFTVYAVENGRWIHMGGTITLEAMPIVV